eukprot:SAG22_NODE_10001_length_559_cov_0.789130_1_plen_177_part_01
MSAGRQTGKTDDGFEILSNSPPTAGRAPPCRFVLFGVLFLVLGVVLLSVSAGVVETEPVSYEANADCMAALRRSRCYASQHDASGQPLALTLGLPLDPLCARNSSVAADDSNVCNVTVTVPAEMQPPIYVYYQLSNYWQNHRRYMSMRSDKQLRAYEREDGGKPGWGSYADYTDAIK